MDPEARERDRDVRLASIEGRVEAVQHADLVALGQQGVRHL
jgi:hypothetical protein